MRTAIVVGSGAGGATVARELQGAFQVTVLEAGRPFRPLALRRPTIERIRNSRLLVDPRLIRAAFPPMQVRTSAGMVMVNGIGVGGTTTLATGNGVRADAGLRALGIDLDAEFDQIGREIKLDTGHQARWHPVTERLFEAFADAGLDPAPLPKMRTGLAACRHCGRCVLGCPYGAKWDSRRYLDQAVAAGARLVTGCRIERLATSPSGGPAAGVVSRGPLGRQVHEADLVVLAAGGFATPAILARSGIACEPLLFVDPVLTVAARAPGAWQCNELAMPFVVQRDHYILSPYFDWLSFMVDPAWRLPAQDLVGIMVKLADQPGGTVTAGGRIHKRLTDLDRCRLDEGTALATDLLRSSGLAQGELIRGTLNAGHPGGMLPLTADQRQRRHLPRRAAAGQRLRRRRQPLPGIPRQPAHPDHHRHGQTSGPTGRHGSGSAHLSAGGGWRGLSRPARPGPFGPAPRRSRAAPCQQAANRRQTQPADRQAARRLEASAQMAQTPRTDMADPDGAGKAAGVRTDPVADGTLAGQEFRPLLAGNELDTVGPGALVGLSWLVPPYRWQFDARAVEPVRSVVLDARCLRAACNADPRLGYELTRRVAALMWRRLHSTRIRLSDLHTDPHDHDQAG